MATANDVLNIARAELGTKESPRSSNNVKYNTWYYGRPVSGNYPWCMAFVQWCLHQAGVTPVIRTASCGALMRAAIRAGAWVTGGYKPGDVVIYDFPGGAATDHTGIIESFDGKYVTAIEGKRHGGVLLPGRDSQHGRGGHPVQLRRVHRRRERRAVLPHGTVPQGLPEDQRAAHQRGGIRRDQL